MLLILKSKKKHPPHTEKTIAALSKKLAQKKVRTKIVVLENLEFFLDTNKILAKINDWTPRKGDCVFLRIAEKYKNASYILTEYFKLKNIPYIDGYHSSTRERNKLIQMFLLAANKVSIPRTYYTPLYDSKKIKNAIKFLNLPVVIKLTNKERGEGVFLARSAKMLSKIIKNNPGEEIILQEFIANDFDYRILVLGDKTALGEKRIRTSKIDFRNNVSKGALEEFIKQESLPYKIKSISEKSASIMNIQVCGVDVIRGRDNKLYIIEVNFSPSFTLDNPLSNELDCLTDYLKKWNAKK